MSVYRYMCHICDHGSYEEEYHRLNIKGYKWTYICLECVNNEQYFTQKPKDDLDIDEWKLLKYHNDENTEYTPTAAFWEFEDGRINDELRILYKRRKIEDQFILGTP